MIDHTKATVRGSSSELPETFYFTYHDEQRYIVGASRDATNYPQCICIGERQPGVKALSIAASQIAVRFSDDRRSLTIIKSNHPVDEGTWLLISAAVEAVYGGVEQATAAEIAAMATLPSSKMT